MSPAAFTEICWPTIERARVKNGAPRRSRATRARYRGARARASPESSKPARQACAASRGRGERQIEEKILRLHAHHAVLVHRQGQINRLAREVRAHRGRVLEIEPKQGEQAAKVSRLDLVAVPQAV